MYSDIPRDVQVGFLLDSQSTGVLWLDAGLCVRYANPAVKSLLQLSSRQGPVDSLAAQLPGNEVFFSSLARVASTCETVTLRELDLAVGSAEGRHSVVVDCTVTAVAETAGATGLLIELAALDRHLRISREASLNDQRHFNRRFARHLAHEIKNPLGSIRGAAQLLERKLADPALAEYTRLVVSEVDRLAALADSLLGPWQPVERQQLNVHEIVEHVMQLSQAASTGTAVLRDYDPSLPELWLNRDQMIQALLNLAKNAREAAGPGGRLVFRTRVLRQFTLNGQRHRLAACIEVEDNGPGIPAELQPYLFAPLVSRKPQGSGLGLSIAQELVSRNGGLIEYHSQPGCTVFSVILPVEAGDGSVHA